MSSSTEAHYCSICFKSYKRREHLQRHIQTHTTSRPYRCSVCNAAFQRTDILRRHVQTCQTKSAEIAPSVKRRACDRCVRQKKACTMDQPCQSCRARTVSCQYAFDTESSSSKVGTITGLGSTANNWESLISMDSLAYSTIRSSYPNGDTPVVTDYESVFDDFLQPQLLESGMRQIGDATMDWIDLLNVTDPHSSSHMSSPSPPTKIRRFKFLYSFTSETGLASSFDCGSLAQRQQAVATISHEGEPSRPQELAEQFTGDSFHGVTSGFSGLLDPLVIKIHQLVHELKEVVTMKPRNSVISLSWTLQLEQQCLEFFSLSNIRCFLAAYWAIWHPNVNFVHMPSFDPAKSKLTLLATMALIGACVHPVPRYKAQAKMWFDCVEEMVFSDDDFCSDFFSFPGRDPSNHEVQRSKTQAVQAAYMVCLYQNWDGSDASRRRIRRYRFSTLVSVVRDLNLDTIQDTSYDVVPGHDFNWRDFIAREELTRTLLWIFLLDTCFVIFNNLPPRMVIKEMQMRMAYPESCFQATTPEACATATHLCMSRAGSVYELSVRDAVEAFCADSISSPMRSSLANLGPLNLFVISSAFHILIFQHMNSFSDIGQMTAIHNALHNWQSVWELYSLDFSTGPPHMMVDNDMSILAPQDMWKRVGFMQHADEFCLLAVLMKDRIVLKSAQQRQEVSPDSSTRDHGRIVDPVLNEYDQNTMRQINDLIASFETIQMQ